MLSYATAGESHGQGLIVLIEGVPSNIPVSVDAIDRDLKRRQCGYGRGGRMKIESDRVRILSGVRHGLTLGSPVAMLIENLDWKNWSQIMNSEPCEVEDSDKKRAMPVTKPRPGHADLTGAIKYEHRDIRNILERSSARETAARVAAGAFAKEILKNFDISIFSWVTEIGGERTEDQRVPGSIYYNASGLRQVPGDIYLNAEASEVRCPDAELTERIKRRIDAAKAEGDSLGGIFELVAQNLPVGLGSHAESSRKLDARIAAAIVSIQAIKGVEFGLGFEEGRLPGSAVHDEIYYKDKSFARTTNFAGGIEGGMTNGQDVVVRAVMKPIPTLYKPLRSVDIDTKEPYEASIERSDTCAVPAAAVIGEAVLAFELAAAFVEKFGGDSLGEISRNYKQYLEYVENF